MVGTLFQNVRDKKPLVHNITNYVTVNDCANITLAIGASPIMADDIDEVEDIVSICNGLNINIGTLNKRTIESMIAAGKRANELNKPVILDPVGAGASKLRTETAQRLLKEVKFSVIRGNISEIKTLAGLNAETRGVDADIDDIVTDENVAQVAEFCKTFARETGAIIVVTGAIDIICDGEKAYAVKNGRSEMSSITGTGCQLSSMLGAFISANTDNVLGAALSAVCTIGLAGEIAYERMTKPDGNSSYRNYIIDAVYNMSAEKLDKGAKYTEI